MLDVFPELLSPKRPLMFGLCNIEVDLNVTNGRFDGLQLPFDLLRCQVVLIIDGHTLQVSQLQAPETVLTDFFGGRDHKFLDFVGLVRVY